MELDKGPEFDLSRRSTQEFILDLARQGRLDYVHLGLPCTVWSMARRNLKNFRRARAKERLGIEFALFGGVLCHILERRGRKWSIENPLGSRLWDFAPNLALRDRPGVCEITLDMCQFSSADRPFKQPSRILTNLPDLHLLRKHCRGGHAHLNLIGG